jgi:hypothetical protein
MAKIFWTYRDVTSFLEKNGFDLYEVLEQFQFWVKVHRKDEQDRFVEVEFTQGLYTEKAIARIIRQSGIDKNKRIKWS